MSSDSASDDMDEIVESNIPSMPNQSFEPPYAEYSFIVIPIDSSFGESPEFLIKIQQMVSSISSFLGCLEFVSESNVPPSAGINVCPPKHVISLILPLLGVMLRIPTALHLTAAYIDDITR